MIEMHSSNNVTGAPGGGLSGLHAETHNNTKIQDGKQNLAFGDDDGLESP